MRGRVLNWNANFSHYYFSKRDSDVTENFNFPLELVDNNANIFPCDGSPAVDKGFLLHLLDPSPSFSTLYLDQRTLHTEENVCDDRERRMRDAGLERKRERARIARRGQEDVGVQERENELETNELNGEIGAR